MFSPSIANGPVAGPSISDSLGRRIHDLRISVTDKCNLRCTYCMPADRYHEHYAFLSKDQLLTFEEIARIARVFASFGVTKLRLTGGEPLLRKELPALISMLRTINGIEDLALTTNGILLPELAISLKNAGLQRVTVSLDTLDDRVFRAMSGRAVSVSSVLAGIRAAEEAGLSPIKINAVVQRGVNENSLVDLADHFRGSDHILRFIEFMDVGTCNGWIPANVVPSGEVLARLHARWPLESLQPTYTGEVAERYRYLDGQGEIGFISSVTQPFCGECNRARLSADGKLYTCLFANRGTDIREVIRGENAESILGEVIRKVWAARSDRYSEVRAESRGSTDAAGRIEMYQIGG